MENDVIDPTALVTEAPETSVDVIEELLVEEISIDGMCGVY
jgi:mycofactocin precursor